MAEMEDGFDESEDRDSSSQPKYLNIVQTLRQKLNSGHYRGGARLPSEAELTRRFKVSRMTVVKAIQHLQQEGLVVRRVGSGTYAAPQDGSESLVFGLLIPDLGETEIFEPICRGMVRSPQAKRHSLLWGHSFASADNKEEQAKQLCQHYLDQKVNGVFFAPLEFSPHRERVNREILKKLDQATIPVVLLDRCGLRFPAMSRHDLVGLDNRRAGYLITEHLLKLGAKNIAFLARKGSVETVEARIVGCREALFAVGRSLVEIVIVPEDAIDSKTIREVLDRRSLDTLVCANDHIAANLMQTLLGLGKRVPEQVRVAGFDDVSYAGLLPVPLTTMHQPCGNIGAAAMSAMLERINNPFLSPRSILLDAHLVVRQSCGTLTD
ncbi:GntR family transcriptional regulator [Tunturiibacter empetritectus]|uniref:DNA-binding LacI/PurR family transcriptional regulator n=2 Tax=Tunturiibacter TaxID=3154218 RepID=A0A852VF69_9BACT|nr:GntR family transcriptional regulator [Edaphobacter lichenicola]NYF90227.1 DNA-binding LacI/PurR family transcriptional regulator [Edaphobacter lichenicola]